MQYGIRKGKITNRPFIHQYDKIHAIRRDHLGADAFNDVSGMNIPHHFLITASTEKLLFALVKSD